MASDSYDEEVASWEDLYNINYVPSDLLLKFRKLIGGYRVGFNFEFYNFQFGEYHTKLVLKPLMPERRWKFIYEPEHGDVRLLTKKIPVTRYLNLQVGIGHSFHFHTTGWKWKLSTCLGGDGISQIRNKSSVSIFPGFDVRIGWKAEYILPEIHGSVGTGESVINMNYGRLHASLDRVEAILTHST
ncbi:hypothetical protein AMTRI_Chr04g242870 [Amborella trichopoda]|uniref:DUF7781 domain-containing protein n=1 Tax=Amborella trichopoda TaxID=13333 RepID=W1PMN2_AMBTC|nr:uncharacterized protein LOC18439459 [Amborella trichopoda]XP_011625313.1 uncharacterized protein LOC18439459 [Amborella trichopoda]XP_020526161.1 uncharacterized protein LOC18439459 [Amborella trichopoda]XP_020526162.1 uncharacterized protein LOC18439459 [Amborella trichopoda]ERN11267.1 hypothetical protein AMTR_s00024p00237330 [Amborella trichopoda]|eukprot:XP_006849686.1 uncharacterized protein LOC18439459 [Amborella trichopoda]